jgi:hypothetical protein
MRQTWERYHHAARHHERAAYHYKGAAKYDEAEEHEKAAHHAYLAHGHNQHAVHHNVEAAKLQAENCDSLAAPASAQAERKKECSLIKRGSILYPPLLVANRIRRAVCMQEGTTPHRAHPSPAANFGGNHQVRQKPPKPDTIIEQ